MCLAIYAKKGSRVSHRTVRRAWVNNPDGAGIMYVEDGHLRIEKFPTSEAALWRRYKDFTGGDGQSPQDRDIVIHFRYKTHGNVCKENCHPFRVHPGLGMVHNGIIDIEQAFSDRRSDTRAFVEDVLRRLSPQFLYNADAMTLLAERVGKHNKLIFMDRKGTVRIVNEGAGFWEGDVWYSNYSGLVDRFWDRRVTYAHDAKKPDAAKDWPDWTDYAAKCDWCESPVSEDELDPLWCEGDAVLCRECNQFNEQYHEDMRRAAEEDGITVEGRDNC
jgi:hypothetical protein